MEETNMEVSGRSPYESLLNKHRVKLGDMRSPKMCRLLFLIQTGYSRPEGTVQIDRRL